ncbi:MAG: site-specific integrase [Candidatus Bipolaricaulota bacterium]|nr:site-specific integrase [Candidatus Bipolaricaulota bacterium]
METISVRELVSRYSRELARLNYKNNTRNNYGVFCNQLISYFDSREQSVFSEEIAVQFLDDRYGLSEVLKRRRLTRNETHVRQMVRKLVLFRRHGTVSRASRLPLRRIQSEKLLDVLTEYGETCRRRGYAKATRENLQHYTVRFFEYLESQSILELSQVTAQTIADYVNSFGAHSYRSIGLHLTCLRNALAFLQESGYHPEDLSAAVPQQQVRRDATVPPTWSQEDVRALLGAIDRGSPCGKRDYAIMLLVARLGLRAGDVRNLRLENLQWTTNHIEFIQSKTSKRASLPLLKDVGWAIIEYLKHGRPESDSPFVFLGHVAPYQKLGDGNCFYHIIRRSARVANLTASFGQRVGMHSLRHSLATTLLEKHTPLSTIAGVLGHANEESTAVYLKTDVGALRECALGSPGGSK